MSTPTDASLQSPRQYLPNDILSTKQRLQANSACTLLIKDDVPGQIALVCCNAEKDHCAFQYLFRKIDLQSQCYCLVTEQSTHTEDCRQTARLFQLCSPLSAKASQIASPSFRKYRPENDCELPRTVSLPLFLPFDEPESEEDKSRMKQQSQRLNNDHPLKLYTEDQVTMLKKQLQYESRGQVSKSTQFHPQLGYITRISFKCKFEPTCPYLSVLRYTFQRNAKNQKLYQLDKLSTLHLPTCLLDDEEIHYNLITRKIDSSLPVLVDILREHSLDMKPKKVLELFATEMGEQSGDFIYEGIVSKINRRAVKKYFDNSVAKARNSLKGNYSFSLSN